MTGRLGAASLAAMAALCGCSAGLGPVSPGPAYVMQRDDVPDVYVPDGPVVVVEPLLPGRGVAGTGHVRLVRDDRRGVVARLDANEFYAYEAAYKRALTALSLRMSVGAAEPLARAAAWDAVVGTARPVGTIGPVPVG